MHVEMTTVEIYDQFDVPESLRLHLLRVAAVARVIADHWTGPSLSRSKLDRVLLLHDIGNIVKIDLDALGPIEPEQLERYRHTQAEYRRKFGSDDHLASREIARQVGLDDSELVFMDAKVFVRNDDTLRSRDFDLKVAAYADQRVAPTGVMGLVPRLREAQRRYRDKPGTSMNNPRTEMLIDCAVRIEAQLAARCTIPMDQIKDDAVAPQLPALMAFRFSV